jgi:hypothetical protein
MAQQVMEPVMARAKAEVDEAFFRRKLFVIPLFSFFP